MKLKVNNIIKYQFSSPVPYGLQRLRLWPRQPLGNKNSWSIQCVGAEKQATYKDHHENQCTLITFLPQVTEVTIKIIGTIKTHKNYKRKSNYKEKCPIWLYQNQTDLTTAGRSIKDFCRLWLNSDSPKISICKEIAHAIKNEMKFDIGQTNAATTAEEAFKIKMGVCQDFAHIFLACMRYLKIPARYVSGYLKMENIKVQDATHAWTEVFLKDLGWVGFDIANNIDIDDKYIALAIGFDYRDTNPVDGFQYNSINERVINKIKILQQSNRSNSQ